VRLISASLARFSGHAAGAWATAIVVGFAMMHWGLESPLNVAPGIAPFSTYLYMSGTTFFTLGLGDVTPMGAPGRALVVFEAGMGFGFLAALISYLPAILYQAFSGREVSISLLDARAGSPPTAGELLRRHGNDRRELGQLLYDWERWSAELLETHLSYPVLAYFRSQHTNQSWLAALTAILDTCALIMAGMNDGPTRQAQLTFAMARHAVADLAQIFTRSRQPVAIRTRRRRGDRQRARRSLSGPCLANRLGHAVEHEPQRGAGKPCDPVARRHNRQQVSGAPERGCEHGTVVQRHLSHRDAHRGVAGARAAPVAACGGARHGD
jgi:hypothetical protein